MATNHYFNAFPETKISEQVLFEDLITECIQINGHDIYYMPREIWEETDRLFGENLNSLFKRAYQMEMYIGNVQEWEGPSDIFSKFGLEIRDGSRFIVSKRTFDKYMPANITIRPREGDLLYAPVMNRVFEIKFIEEELNFFTRGLRIPYMYELKVELFRWNREKLDTGVEVIDALDDNYAYTIKLPLTGTGAYNKGEIVYQGANLVNSTASATVSKWDSFTKELYIIEIKGEFTSSANVIGTTSNTSMTVTDIDSLSDNAYYDMFDNKELEDEANTFVNATETNPFGAP